MLKYILKRLLMMVPVLLGVVIITFTMMYFSPGEAEDFILGDLATEADKEVFREENGLNGGYFERLFRYIGGVLQGDFGISYTTRQPVINEITARFGTTFMLTFFAILFASILGIILGIISAVKQYSLLDNITRIFAMLGVSMPAFWEGLMLIILFSVILQILPSSGLTSWKHWILPVITLGTTSLASIMRMVRSSMLEAIRQDYVDTARAKGQKEFVITMRHVFRNALLPTLTTIGTNFSKQLGGAAVIEIVFSVPGIGKLIVDAINLKNAPLVQGGILFIAFFMSFINLLVDIIYALVDPRIRSQYGSSAKMHARAKKSLAGAGTEGGDVT